MAVQAVLGLVLHEQYRDVAWIKATWLGNDWVTLVLAVPLLAAALAFTRRGQGRGENGAARGEIGSSRGEIGSVRGQLLGLGVLGYGAYNYAFYLFGAALNVFFPLYVVAFVLSVVGLILALARTRPIDVAARFVDTTAVSTREGQGGRKRPGIRERAVGGYLVFVASGLAAVWAGFWAAYVFWGRPTPVEPEAFKLVAALDLSLMVPALAAGGILLWRRHPWGYVVAAIAGIQGTLYLIVLSVNSVLAIAKGLAQAPGELPLWGTLGVGTLAATLALLAGAADGKHARLRADDR